MEEENEVVERDNSDYTEYLQSILDNQAREIELLEQNQQILLEEVNGLSLVVNYQFTTIGIVVVFSVVIVAWKILSKWFFGGV